MSSVPSKLLTYYSNKINIYDNDSFIPLPDWTSCPPLPQIYIMPEFVYPSPGPYIPPVIVPIQPPLYYPGAYCGNKTTPCGPCGTSGTSSCGPCGR